MPFSDLYHQNYQQVYRLAYKIVGDEEMSKDISQEVFIKLFQTIEGGTQILNVKSWLYRVSVNYCYNHLRNTKKSKTSTEIYLQSDYTEPESTFIEYEDEQKIRDMMLHLKEKEQLILALYSESMSYKEMAEASGIPLSSVGTTLVRALLKLKRLCHDTQF